MIRLNHIGIAVANLPQVTKLFEILGVRANRSEAVPSQGVNAHFIPFAEGEAELFPLNASSFELLEPTDPNGTVAQFIKKKGPGIHHLSFEVGRGELEGLCARLKAEGFRLIYDSPKPGAHGMKINFIHPASAGGMLIEVMEPV